MSDTVPAAAVPAPPSSQCSKWPGVECHWDTRRQYFLVTLTEGADLRSVLTALATKVCGLEVFGVDVEARSIVFRVPSSLAWRSAVDAVDVS